MNLRKVVLATVAALAAGCTEGIVGPTGGGTRSGQLEILLATEAVGVGALAISITGGTTDSVASPVGLRVFTAASGQTLQVILVGNILPGPIALFTIPDRGQAAAYQVEVTGAAYSRSYVLLDPADFTLTLRSTSLPR